jgi:hypothetical protein
MSRKKTSRREFLSIAAAGGTLVIASPGRLSARGEPQTPLQDRPIVVRGGSADVGFDETTYVGSGGKYTGTGRQITRVNFQRPNGNQEVCTGTGPVKVRCANPNTTITIQNIGSDISIEFDETVFHGAAGSNHRGKADAVLLDLQVGAVTCFKGRVATITVHTT